jgi:hypothetical protein
MDLYLSRKQASDLGRKAQPETTVTGDGTGTAVVNANVTELKRLGMNGKELGKFNLPPSVFDVEVNEHVLYEYVRNYLANQRQGTSSVKTRATMSGGGKKPWRQKGSGRARAGTKVEAAPSDLNRETTATPSLQR